MPHSKRKRRQRQGIIRSRGRACFLCLQTFESGTGETRLTLHHLKRQDDGGKNTQDNMVLLCGQCHRLAERAILSGTDPWAVHHNKVFNPAMKKAQWTKLTELTEAAYKQ